MGKIKLSIGGFLICFFIFSVPCLAQRDVYLSGKVTDIDGEYLYIDFDKTQGIEKGMVFGVYDVNKRPVAICEITRFHFEKSFLAFILIQTEDVKKGDSVFSNTAEEYKLREKIKKEKDKGEDFDFFKSFDASHKCNKKNSGLAEDFLLYQLVTKAIEFLKLDIYWFKKYNLENREEIFLNQEEKKMLDIYRDIISENSVFNINWVNTEASIEAKINLGKLKHRLKQQGYSLKPKMIRLSFPLKVSNDDIRLLREIILENSMYVSAEETNSQDITDPVSCIIYTIPKVFAEEISNFDLEGKDIFINLFNVQGDTIELDVISR